jgi:hypothetical protein
MTCAKAIKIIELIEKLDVHTCLGLKCDGNCTKMCAAGGGHNKTLVNFYKNRIIDMAYDEYYTAERVYTTAEKSAEERDDIHTLKCELIKAEKHLDMMIKLYKV